MLGSGHVVGGSMETGRHREPKLHLSSCWCGRQYQVSGLAVGRGGGEGGMIWDVYRETRCLCVPVYVCMYVRIILSRVIRTYVTSCRSRPVRL